MGTLETMKTRRINSLKIAIKQTLVNKTMTLEELETIRTQLQLEIDAIEFILNDGDITKYASSTAF